MKATLSGKTALITGAAADIGAAIARCFVAEGAQVLLLDTDADRGVALAESLGDRAIFMRGDVSDHEIPEKAIQKAIDHFGSLDILVNNAGILIKRSVYELTVEEFERILSINLTAGFTFAQAAARAMKERGGGTIINMPSVNAVHALPDQVPYAVGKGGVSQLTRAMAVAMVGDNIRVNAIGPATPAPELVKSPTPTDTTTRSPALARTPMGRLGEPGEVANVALFLASDESSTLTGQTIFVDRGRQPLHYAMPVAA
ncbi:MAG: glucose 1-dehydrogenase [Burkholderiaceae bacterium]